MEALDTRELDRQALDNYALVELHKKNADCRPCPLNQLDDTLQPALQRLERQGLIDISGEGTTRTAMLTKAGGKQAEQQYQLANARTRNRFRALT